MDVQLLLAVVGSIALLLLLVLRFKLQAFLALLLAAMAGGLLAGMPTPDILATVTQGMGGTLGFVATIIGLGAILGGVLEHSGGTQALAQWLLRQLGERRAPLALVLAGFLVAIPVFFDVAFILLVPMLYALGRKTGRSLLYYGIPLLAGLATTHAFIPPTPGPIAVADILTADLGWVIAFGFLVGLPTVAVAGLWWGRYCGGRYQIIPPAFQAEGEAPEAPPIGLLLLLILMPIVLILANTLTKMLVDQGHLAASGLTDSLQFLGHPFVALLLACLLALYSLGYRRGVGKEDLQALAGRALLPAGTIILITGAGGVYKQMLVNSGAGEQLAALLLTWPIWPPVLAFVLAGLVRILQGSATVAMITAAGLLAPVLPSFSLNAPQLALLVLSIAAGGSTLSHVNDSGFWLVKEYLGMSEATTLRTWTLMTLWLSLTALLVILALWMLC